MEVVIVAEPVTAWADIEEFKVDIVSDDEHLTGEVKKGARSDTEIRSYA